MMKKTLFLGLCAFALIGTSARADNIQGTVTDINGNIITIQPVSGDAVQMKTNDKTSYRQKKIIKKYHKKSRKGKQGEGYFKPMIDEDDWVEIVYTPDGNAEYWIEKVVVYDD